MALNTMYCNTGIWNDRKLTCYTRYYSWAIMARFCFNVLPQFILTLMSKKGFTLNVQYPWHHITRQHQGQNLRFNIEGYFSIIFFCSKYQNISADCYSISIYISTLESFLQTFLPFFFISRKKPTDNLLFLEFSNLSIQLEGKTSSHHW